MSDESSATRRRKRRPSYESNEDDTDPQPNKDEKAVARFLRFGLPEREGKLVGIVVKVFVASEALDALMDSKWARPGPKTPFLFQSRDHAEAFMEGLLQKRIFHRAEKVKKKTRRSKTAVTSTNTNSTAGACPPSGGQKKDSNSKEKQLANEDEGEDQGVKEDIANGSDKQVTEGGSGNAKGDKKKDKLAGKKARVKLEMHDDQNFIDGDNIYVWIYDPIRPMNLILGVLILVVVVVCCLFPLWPAQLRSGAYYVSLGGMGLLGSLLGLSLIRAVVFGLVWLLSAGKHHFWLLPNLTEDCGFFDSFVPLYSYQLNLKNNNNNSSKSSSSSTTSTSTTITNNSNTSSNSKTASVGEDKKKD